MRGGRGLAAVYRLHIYSGCKLASTELCGLAGS